MEELSLINFRHLWKQNVSELESKCGVWQTIRENNVVPEDVLGEIRTTIGLAKLLIAEKLKQFSGLIDDSELKTGEKEVTLEDLQGFWDMVYWEVEKIHKRFNDLQDCQNNDWKFIEKHEKKLPKAKVPKKMQAKKVESSNSHALAAKQRLLEIKKKMAAQRKKESEENSVKNATSEEAIPTPENKDAVTKPEKLTEETHSPKKIAKTKKFQQAVKTSLVDKENTPENTPITKAKKTKENKKAEKQKDVVKLQCLTRSAKKALLAKQNTEKNQL